MENNEEGIQPIQPAVPTENTEPAAPQIVTVNDSTIAEPTEPAAPATPVEPVVAEPATPTVMTEPVAPAAPAAPATPITINETAAEEFASEETPVSDELLQEMHELNSEPQTNPNPSNVVLTDAPKKSHALVILLIVLLVGLVAAAGVFAYFYFNKPTTSAPRSDNTSNTSTNTTNTTNPTNPTNPTKPTQPSTTPTTDTTNIIGTAITDSSVTEELTQKISTLLGIKPNEDLTFASDASIITRDIDLIENGDITDGQRLHAVVFGMQDLFEPLTDEQVDTIETEDNVSLVFAEKTAVDATLVAEVYENLFGEAPTHQNTEGVCKFSYNESLDVYYNGNAGCGGTFPNYRFYHITDFTEAEDSAYVYIKVASIYEDSDIFCDVSTNPVESNFKTCGTASATERTVDFSDQSAEFARYRFVFNEAENGSYYFVKLEKVQ